MMSNATTKRLTKNLLIFSAAMLLGTIGFSLLENYSLLDSIYFTIATVATVGYGDMAPVTTAGRSLAIILIVTGVGSVLGVIASSAELFLNRRENQARVQKLHMLVGLFYSELGNQLLRYCADADPLADQQRQPLLIAESWDANRFRTTRQQLKTLPFGVEVGKLELSALRDFLTQRSDLLARLLESPFLLENLPEPDTRHLTGDINRVYLQLVRHWLGYSEHLQQNYPYLYSLAVRTNPFKRDACATIY